jgi:hypothetical protein
MPQAIIVLCFHLFKPFVHLSISFNTSTFRHDFCFLLELSAKEKITDDSALCRSLYVCSNYAFLYANADGRLTSSVFYTPFSGRRVEEGRTSVNHSLMACCAPVLLQRPRFAAFLWLILMPANGTKAKILTSDAIELALCFIVLIPLLTTKA